MRTRALLHSILLSAFLTVVAQNAAQAGEGPGGTGGGNMIAAEIQRATDEFIQTVKANESFFGIKASQLAVPGVQIRVTSHPILSCDGQSEFDAGSTGTQSVFNRFNWLNQDSWLSKVHLAGHERLILVGLERSNQYTISNKLFSIGHRARSEALMTPPQVCAALSGEVYDCLKGLSEFRKSVAMVSSLAESQRDTVAELLIHVEIQLNSANSMARMFEDSLRSAGRSGRRAHEAAWAYRAYLQLLIDQLKEQIENVDAPVDVGCVRLK